MRLTVAFVAMLLLCIGSVSQANQDGAKYEVGVQLGFDSNPLRMMNDGPDSFFTDLRVEGQFRREVSSRAKWILDGQIRQRIHEGSMSDADDLRADLYTGFLFTPVPNRVSIALGTGYELSRSTYVDRETGTVFEYGDPLDPDVTYLAPDRYDHDTIGLYANLRYKVGPRFLLFVNSRVEQDRFVESFEGLDNLDSRSLRTRPGVRVRLNDAMTVGISLDWIDRDYDHRPALDANGDPVDGVMREYRSLQLRADMRYVPSDAWLLRFGIRSGDRDDTYAGYYDYGSRLAYLSVERELERAGSLSLSVSRRETDYDSATVSTADDALRVSDSRAVRGKYELAVREGMDWFVEGGVSRADSTDPVYANDRDWITTGFVFRK